MRKFFILVAFGLMSIRVFASCDAAQDEVERANCAYDEQKKAEYELSSSYNKALSTLDETERVNLVKAQKMWWAFKEYECDAVSESNGLGTSAVIIGAHCRTDKSVHRVAELKNLYGID